MQKSYLLLFLLLAAPRAFTQTRYTLQQALRESRTNNLQLKAQRFDASITSADEITAKLRPNPTLGFSYSPSAGSFAGINTQANIQVGKVFQLPSTRQSKINLAEQSTTLAQKNYTEAERNVFQDVALSWLDVWSAQKQLEIVRMAKVNLDSIVLINKSRLKNEVITTTDFNRTALLASQYELQLKSLEQDLRNQQADFKFMLGTNDEISIDDSDDLNYDNLPDFNTLLKDATENRSDVLAAKSLIEVANANINLQRSLANPQPELGVLYNPQNSVHYYGVFGGIDIPVFSRNQGEIKKSEYIKQQAEQNLATADIRLKKELNNAYASYQALKDNVAKTNVLLQQSENILKSVRYAYLRGGTTIIDFLEAQRSWLDTRQQYYNLVLQYRISYVKLLYASGLINKIAQ